MVNNLDELQDLFKKTGITEADFNILLSCVIKRIEFKIDPLISLAERMILMEKKILDNEAVYISNLDDEKVEYLKSFFSSQVNSSLESFKYHVEKIERIQEDISYIFTKLSVKASI